MRTIAIYFITVLLCLQAQESHAWKDSVAKSVTLGDQHLVLAHVDRASSGFFIAEYIPAGETLDKWSVMYAVRLFPNLPGKKIEPQMFLANSVTNLENRKKAGDSVANGSRYQHKDSKHLVFDFIISDGIGKPITILEHNTHFFLKHKNGVAQYQLAYRHYVDAETEEGANKAKLFLKEIPARQKDNFTQITCLEYAIPE